MRLTHLHDESTSKPFSGDTYHCELFMDSSAPEADSIAHSFYVASAYAGGMRQQTIKGIMIRRGSKVLSGTGVIKEYTYAEIYCDPEQTANHGLQMQIQNFGFMLVTKFSNLLCTRLSNLHQS